MSQLVKKCETCGGQLNYLTGECAACSMGDTLTAEDVANDCFDCFGTGHIINIVGSENVLGVPQFTVRHCETCKGTGSNG